MTARNIVLYTVDAGARMPRLSCDPDDPLAQLKVGAKIMAMMHDADRRGAPHPDFKCVLETREADEGGRFVISASFQEMHPVTGQALGAPCKTLDEVFKKRDVVAAPVLTPEQAAEAAKAAASQTLSV